MNETQAQKDLHLKVELLTPGSVRQGTTFHLVFKVSPIGLARPGSRLWMLHDIRQDPGSSQADRPEDPNFLSARASSGKPVLLNTYETRSLDLYPRVPEFFHVCEFEFPDGLPADDVLLIELGGNEAGWQAPRHPISRFRFWFLDDFNAQISFDPIGYKTYRAFTVEHPERLQERIAEVAITVTGAPPQLDDVDRRKTPGIFWGDLHGMAFNQRPLDDYYQYARDIAGFDFAAALLFSYNICVADIWQEVKSAAERWSEPGRFLPVVGFEAATVPDGSHRNVYFLSPEKVRPIFCEDRPPARDNRLTRRFHPETIFCNSLEEYYQAVDRFDGIVTGHFHTLKYDREVLAEIWQKQVGPQGDEAHIFELLNSGMHFGIVGGSDTHDSMPGNPSPEPYCLQPAGFMAVIADALSPDDLKEAILKRRVYATSGARIVLDFRAGNAVMGNILTVDAQPRFNVRVEGTAPIEKLELIYRGEPILEEHPGQISYQES